MIEPLNIAPVEIIGLTGFARSGKSTVAEILWEEHGFFPISFADPIKNALYTMFGIEAERIEKGVQKEVTIDWIGKSPRELLQTLGTEWGRNRVNEDIWLKVAAKTAMVEVGRHSFRGIVFTDVRFPNEADWIIASGGRILHVQRPGEHDSLVKGHVSEKSLNYFKYEPFFNNGSLEDLRKEVQAAIENGGKP